MPRFYVLKANPDVRSRVRKDMIPHNSLTGKTPAYIVIYIIIRIEQYFCREPTSTIGALQRDHAMVRT